MVKTVEEIKRALNDRYVTKMNFLGIDQESIYFNYGSEEIKVRKLDCAVFYRFQGQTEWKYDAHLYQEMSVN